MQADLQTIHSSQTYVGQQHRVLRNTYALLGLSMIPTVIGALLGTMFGVSLMVASPMITMVLFLAVSWGLIFAIEKNRNSGLGVVLLLGFTFFMGLMLGPLLAYTLHFRNGGQLIAMAAGGTGAIFFTLAGIASTGKRDFSKMGTFLLAGAILILVAAIANAFLHLPALAMAISLVAIVVFSGFILFDIDRIVKGGETSYVSATLAVYLDVYNIFISLLQLLGVFGGDRD
ncbi:MAG: Bax inhibitor-1/YccA family protein [Rhodocyclaceae bacterium]|nr:MAG: Bax inhibitor-1/YccA family protein [Rhodocyclaceae bacterium]